MDILQRKKNPWIETLVKAFPGGIPKQSFAQLLAVNPSVGSCSINDGACVIDAIIQPDCLAATGLPFSAMEGFVVKLTEFTLSVIGVGSGRRLGLRVSKMEVHSADNLNAVGPSKPIYSSPAYKQISIDAPPSPLRAPSALTQLALHIAAPSVASVPASWLPKGIQLPVITGCISAASCAIPPHSARLLDAIVAGWRSETPAASAASSAAAAPVIIADSQSMQPAEPVDVPAVVNVHDSLIWRCVSAIPCIPLPNSALTLDSGLHLLPTPSSLLQAARSPCPPTKIRFFQTRPHPNSLPSLLSTPLVPAAPLCFPDHIFLSAMSLFRNYLFCAPSLTLSTLPGILSLFVTQPLPAPPPAPPAADAAATAQPQPPAAPPVLRPALPRDAKRRRLVRTICLLCRSV
jgi:hypothetical protein